MTDFIVAFVTVSSKEEAERIAYTLVHDQLAACVNILSPIQSIYRWEGDIQNDVELMLVIKTRRALFDDVSECVHRLHSYEKPEVIAVPIEAGDAPYLSWVRDTTTQG